MLITLALYAGDFPKYDFTFYRTSDETLTAFNSDDLGIDVTGYGFIGTESERGIYLRIGIQTPLSTLIKLRDDFFSSGTETETTTTENNSYTLPIETTPSPVTTEPSIAPIEETFNVIPTLTPVTEETVEETTSTPIEIDASVLPAETVSTKKSSINSTKWKFLFSIGPAYRSTMGENAFVYAGFGLTTSTEISHKFSESGDYTSSFFIILSSDIDLGFKVWLTNTRTSIRIGFHSITNVIGYSETKIFNEDNVITTDNIDLYGYLAGRYGFLGATKARGYIRLATTISDNRSATYNYSNTTQLIGKGRLVKVRD